MNKKLILLVGGAIIFLMSIVVIRKIVLRPIPSGDQLPLPSLASSLSESVNFTGANDAPPSNQTSISQSYELRKKLPIIMDEFDISYDYTKAKFIVTMKTSTQKGMAQLNQWHNRNYSEIADSEFIIIEKQ